MLRAMGVTLALLSMLGFGTNILVSRHAVVRMPIEQGFLIALAINVVVSLLAFAADLTLTQRLFSWHWNGAWIYAFSGFVGTYLGRRLMFDTVRLLGPARASVLHSCTPVFSMIAAWALVGERLGAFELILMAVVMFGLWFTQPPSTETSLTAQADRRLIHRGMLIGILTIAGFGASKGLRGLGMREWAEPILASAIGSGTGLVLQLITTRKLLRVLRDLLKGDRRGMLLYAISGIATAWGGIFLVAAMAHIEIALAALVTHTTPLLVFPVSVFIYRNREALTWRTLGGALLVLGGITLLLLR
jgi:drug/metabolite transporter (DMT)-like permease